MASKDLTRHPRAAEQYERIIETTLDGFCIMDDYGRFLEVNDAFCRLLGYTRDEALEMTIRDVEATETGADTREHMQRIMEIGADHFETRHRRKDGNLIDFEVTTSYSKVTNRFYAFMHDITKRKRTKKMSDALNEINMIVGSTFDFTASMPEVISKAIEAIGCEAGAVVLREGDHWAAVYISGLPPEFEGMTFTDDQVSHFGIVRETKVPLVVNNVGADKRVTSSLTKESNIKSFVLVPLIVKGDVFGVCSFHYTSAPTAFTETQIDFAQKLAAALSLVITNINLFKAQHEIAETLQEALQIMPDNVPGLRFGHLYESASEASRVGGDFYDLFELDRNRVGIVIGDVSGKGLKAAAMTSLIKSSIRSYAFEGLSPAVVLTKTNGIITKTLPEFTFVTAFFGILDRSNGRLFYCAAGHPPVLRQGKDGSIEKLGVCSPAIGIFEDSIFNDPNLILEREERLVLYTDGLIEARCGKEFFGEEGLCRSLEGNAATPVEKLPSAIFSDVQDYIGGILSDDLAILALSRG